MHKMCKKVVATIVIIVALALAIVVSIWHQQGLAYIIFVSRFFDVMLPVLAVGALIKYLIHSDCHHDDHCKKG
ncbi:MAG: hypothetical protein ACD_21C00324G0005 [uncultured bacterium]|nr:MAG: hypothetical protein ACD_21C00324G0005 [uncultured bacterium]